MPLHTEFILGVYWGYQISSQGISASEQQHPNLFRETRGARHSAALHVPKTQPRWPLPRA